MRPRTALQKRVSELSAKLPALTDTQRRWAEGQMLTKVAYYSKGMAWCSCCGRGFQTGATPLEVSVLKEHCTCPCCGAHLEMKASRRTRFKEKFYVTFLTTVKEFQVLRHFVVSRDAYQFEQPYVTVSEAVQNWISPDGTVTHVARRLRPFTRYYDDWDYYSPMQIRELKRSSCGVTNDGQYLIESAYIYPGGSITAELRRRGYNRKVLMAADCMIALLKNDYISETLIKNRQYVLLRQRLCGRVGNELLPSIRICIRNRYNVKNATQWIDYIRCLIGLGKDIRNAHYVCPRNLTKAHDDAVTALNRKRAERRRRNAIVSETEYAQDKGRYFGICFGNDDIVITVIGSVAEMEDEGKAMHHCVFTAGYYKRHSCLILSAKNRDGERLATIEINLQSYNVVQCRGVCNSVPAQYDEIVKLVQDNIGLIRRTS